MSEPLFTLSAIATDTAVLLMLGGLLALSLMVDVLARRLGLPRVSLLVLTGVAIATAARVLLEQEVTVLTAAVAEPLVSIALVMVAFLLGGDLTAERWRLTGRPVLALSLAIALVSALLVGGGLLALGFLPAIALPLAAMAVATDPAAVHEVVREAGGGGRVGQVVLGIVAIDDAWGIIAFGVAVSLLELVAGADGWHAVGRAGWELGGALLLGLAIGAPAAFLTGRLRPGEPTQVEAVAVILLIAGLADALAVSPLLAGMTAGVAVANLTPHHSRSFSEIEHIEWPFLVFFFVAAGAAADPARLGAAAPLTLAYLALRVAGRLLGGWAALPWLAGPDRRDFATVGLGLLPQAGVAMGMALLAAERYPAAAADLLAVAVAATIFFEIAGPLLTRRQLGRAA